MTIPAKAQELRSLITDGKLELSLQDVDVPTPGPGEVVVRIEAAPINPSDQPLLLGPADLSTLASDGNVTSAAVPEAMAGLVDPNRVTHNRSVQPTDIGKGRCDVPAAVLVLAVSRREDLDPRAG